MALAVMLRVDHRSDPGLSPVPEGRLADLRGPVDDQDIPFLKVQTGQEIGDESGLGKDGPVADLIDIGLPVYDLHQGFRPVLIVEPSHIEMGFVVHGGIVLRKQPSAGKVILSDQLSPGDILHPLDDVTVPAAEKGIGIDPQLVEIVADLSLLPDRPPLLCRKGGFQLPDGISSGADGKVRKVGVEPYDLMVLEADVPGHVLYVLHTEHIRKDELYIRSGPAQQPGPVGLGIFHTAAGPADPSVNVVNCHNLPSSGSCQKRYPARSRSIPSPAEDL